MFYATKSFEISASHKLDLPYESKCNNLHGHNYRITIHGKSDQLNENSMVFDFAVIKRKVHKLLDHQHLNEFMDHPTAEHLAEYIYGLMPNEVFKVEVYETDGNYAAYEVSN